MFLFRLFKKLLLLVLFAGLVWWGANYKINGKPLYQIAKNFLTSSGYQEGMKDLKLFFGGFLKTMGEQIQETVTEADKKQLEKVIQNQLHQKEPFKEIKK